MYVFALTETHVHACSRIRQLAALAIYVNVFRFRFLASSKVVHEALSGNATFCKKQAESEVAIKTCFGEADGVVEV